MSVPMTSSGAIFAEGSRDEDEVIVGAAAPDPSRRWSLLLLLVGAPFGLFFALATPPLQEIDGNWHLFRIQQLAHGDLVPTIQSNGAVVRLADGCTMGLLADWQRRGVQPGAMSLRQNFSRPPCLAPRVVDLSSTAVNSPVSYAPQAVGYAVGAAVDGPLGGVYGGRLAGLAVYLALCWLAIRITPRAHALLFVVAVLPSSLGLAASLSADPMAIALALLATALLLRSRDLVPDHTHVAARRARWLTLAGLTATLVLLAVSKNLYAAFALLAILVPAAAFGSRRARWGWVGATIGAVAIAALGWSALVVTRVRVAIPGLGTDSKAQIHRVEAHPGRFVTAVWHGFGNPWVTDHSIPGFVEVLGWFRPHVAPLSIGDPAPLALVGVAVCLIAAALFDGVRSRAEEPESAVQVVTASITVLAVMAASTVLIFLGAYAVAEPVGSDTVAGVQGRYFLPLVPLLAVPVSIATRPLTTPSRTRSGLVVGGSLLLLGWVVWRVFVIFY
jgi:hypothetical protein